MTQTAVITGATKGIGKATAFKFLEEGYHIAICARNLNDLEQLQAKWQSQFPNQKILALQADFSIHEEVKAFANKVITAFDTIDVLVNNAGIFMPGTVLEEEEAQFRHQMEVNLFSAYTMTKLMADQMQKREAGHIINVCSIAGLQAYAGGTGYSISKYAMLGLSDNFRAALSPFKVKVSAICPGPTMSHSWEGTGVDENKLMPAAEIAQLIFNCSQMSFNTCVERLVVQPTQSF